MHSQPHRHPLAPLRELPVHQSLLAANDRQGERNRRFFSEHRLLVLNLLSSPGSGKTALLQKTIERTGAPTRFGVIVGDLETDNDARRLRATGAPVVQITTGTLCHLDAEIIARATGNLDLETLEVLAVENVGNLVCPADFDLGETFRVALISVTEGEDKPLKYPPLFRGADAILITKTDLMPHVDYDRKSAMANIRRVNSKAQIFEVSSKTGEGMDAWCGWLMACREMTHSSSPPAL